MMMSQNPYLVTTQNPYVVTTNNTVGYASNQVQIHGVNEQASCLQEHELTTEPFHMKIEDLVNLWLAKYGNEWVAVQEVSNDNYYKYVYKRLYAVGELEQHYLTDRMTFVCRKPD